MRLEVLVSGRVQGVFFRASTREQARRLGLSGWVRNLPDGTVQACFEGSDTLLREMLTWCRSGPPGARVSHVEAVWKPAPEGLPGFSIRY